MNTRDTIALMQAAGYTWQPAIAGIDGLAGHWWHDSGAAILAVKDKADLKLTADGVLDAPLLALVPKHRRLLIWRVWLDSEDEGEAGWFWCATVASRRRQSGSYVAIYPEFAAAVLEAIGTAIG